MYRIADWKYFWYSYVLAKFVCLLIPDSYM